MVTGVQVPQPHILVVDDDAASRVLVRALSQRFEFSFHICASGEEALETYRNAEKRFTHILLDIRMPGMDGYECTRRLREIQREMDQATPILAVTASAMTGDKEKCLQSGFDDYLSKPYTTGQFLDLIARWCTVSAD